jgi:hypothetical protein
MSSPLHLYVFVVPYKPIAGLIPPMSAGEATWPATSDLDAVIAGDVAYNGIHPWLAFTDHGKRLQWLASIGHVEALDPRIVVAGHKHPDAPDDDPAAILGGTRTYIRDFEQSLAECHSAQALVDKMIARHGDLGNPYTLWTAAQAVIEQGQGASS